MTCAPGAPGCTTTILPGLLGDWAPLDDQRLHDVWASDQALYPAPALTYERLRGLARACPGLSICYLRGGGQQPADTRTGTAAAGRVGESGGPGGAATGTTSRSGGGGGSETEMTTTATATQASADQVHGLIIAWPLLAGPGPGPGLTSRYYWQQLLDHTIQEHDVTPAMFPLPEPATRCTTSGDGDDILKTTPTPQPQQQVGLHVFHIERFPTHAAAAFPSGSPSSMARTGAHNSFTRLALDDVRRRVAEDHPSWEVVGYSGKHSKSNPPLPFSPIPSPGAGLIPNIDNGLWIIFIKKINSTRRDARGLQGLHSAWLSSPGGQQQAARHTTRRGRRPP